MLKKVIASAIMYDGRGRILLGEDLRHGLLTTPGGKVNGDELIETALRRELREEAGVEAARTSCLGFVDLLDKLIFFYLVHFWTGEIQNTEPKKHGPWQWYSEMPGDGRLVPGIIAFKKNQMRRAG
jgi:8-oxo-dGTP pyrophosphatase MutT (NUDIX family)